MAGNRTLKLSILGDVDNLNKSLKTASGDVDSFGDKVGKAGIAIGKAFAAAAAAAGAAAIAIGIEGVKAAIADEKAQTQLALALENATGATQAQIKATEDSILQMSLATGVADDELRPALGRLVRSTGDITKAQDLLSTALDISAATGKPVEAIANSLAKAYDGNTAALGKLGVGLSTAELKTMSFEQVQGRLSELFGGAAARNADTYAGKIARVQVAFDEAKETVGAALLPIVEKLSDYVLTTVVPNLESFINGLTGKGSLTEASKNATDGAYKFGEQVKKVITTVVDLKEELGLVAALFATVFVVSKIVAGVQATIALIKTLTAAYAALRNTALAAAIAARFAANPFLGLASAAAIAGTIYAATKIFDNADKAQNAPSTGAIPFASGFAASPGGTYVPPMSTPTIVVPSTGGVTTASKVAATTAAAATNVVSGSFNAGTFRTAEAATSGTTINLTVTGAFDKEGTARTIVETLNNSYYRGTGGASALQAI